MLPHATYVCVCVDEMKDTTIYEYPNSVYSQNVYLPNKVKAKQDAGDVPGTQRKREDRWARRWGGGWIYRVASDNETTNEHDERRLTAEARQYMTAMG